IIVVPLDASITLSLSLHVALPIYTMMGSAFFDCLFLTTGVKYRTSPIINAYNIGSNITTPGPTEKLNVPIASVAITVINTSKWRSEEHTSELQSRFDVVCRLLHEQ